MKDSDGKLPWHLLPQDAMEELVKVLDFGAKKYGERDWEKGIPYSEIISALMRHQKLFFQDGEDRDVESGLLHTAHILCNAMFLLTYQIRELKGVDDRPRDKCHLKNIMFCERCTKDCPDIEGKP